MTLTSPASFRATAALSPAGTRRMSTWASFASIAFCRTAAIDVASELLHHLERERQTRRRPHHVARINGDAERQLDLCRLVDQHADHCVGRLVRIRDRADPDGAEPVRVPDAEPDDVAWTPIRH